MWKCPKCKREFAKVNQMHSCRVYPLIKHFENKPYGEALFNELVKRLKLKVKIESLPCCIHLLSKTAFSGVWILKDKIKLDFRLNREIKSRRFLKVYKISANRYMHYLEIKDKPEIDKELLTWLKESYSLSLV